MTNIEIFNAVAAATFKRLYEAFPKPITINASELKGDAGIADQDWWEYKHVRLNPAGCALEWLRDEGFIRYKDESGRTSFADVILTAKGFAALNKCPDSLQARPTIGDRLKELSKTASSETVGMIVRTALGGVWS